MTREHKAWEMLIRRLNYLNTFDGNRSEMEKTTRIVEQIWDDARHEEEPVTTPARRMGGSKMSTMAKLEHVVIQRNESPYPIPYGQLYCPICNGQTDTGFRCMGCGRQSCPPKGQVFITMPDGWKLSKRDV